MRCTVCGMVVDESEPKTAMEIAKGVGDCKGCQRLKTAALGHFTPVFEMMELGGIAGRGQRVPVEIGEERTFTDDQAHQLAWNSHRRRCQEELDAQTRLRLQRNADGFDATDGVTPLADFVDAKGVTHRVADFKAHAAAALVSMDTAAERDDKREVRKAEIDAFEARIIEEAENHVPFDA